MNCFDLPVDFRYKDAEAILLTAANGDSCSIVGAGAVGKSNLYHFLLRKDVQQRYLINAAEGFLFVGINTHSISKDNWSEAGFCKAMFESLGAAAEVWNGSLAHNLAIELQQLRAEELTGAEAKTLRHALKLCSRAAHTVVIIDQFDELYAQMSARLFINFRAWRDENKYRLVYVVFTRDDLRYIRSDPSVDDFYELMHLNVMGLKPYTQKDTSAVLKKIASHYKIFPTEAVVDALYWLSGGHAGLLKATWVSLIRIGEIGGDKNVIPDQAAWELLLESNNEIQMEIRRLLESLREDEIQALYAVVEKKPGRLTEPAVKSLHQKGIFTASGAVLSPLVSTYVHNHGVTPGPMPFVQAGPIRVDTAGDVWVNDKCVQPPLTRSELAILVYLCTHANQLCSKDEIDLAAHPNEYGHGAIASDEAITTMVSRLRKRLEQTDPEVKILHTVHGKGFLLRV